MKVGCPVVCLSIGSAATGSVSRFRGFYIEGPEAGKREIYQTRLLEVLRCALDRFADIVGRVQYQYRLIHERQPRQQIVPEGSFHGPVATHAGVREMVSVFARTSM